MIIFSNDKYWVYRFHYGVGVEEPNPKCSDAFAEEHATPAVSTIVRISSGRNLIIPRPSSISFVRVFQKRGDQSNMIAHQGHLLE